MVRISAQLINAASQITVWQMQYDRAARDLFAVQEEIAVAVADALDVKLSAAPPTGEIAPEIYEAYLRLTRKTDAGPVAERARVAMADEITRRAPMFGRGWLQAAQSRATAMRNVAMSPEERRRLDGEMRSAIARATQLLGVDDPMLTAIVVNWEPWVGAWTGCETRLRHALERSPHSANLRSVLGSLMLHAGRVSESVAIFSDMAARDPLTSNIAMALGVGLSSAERHDEAFAHFETACRRWPKVWFSWYYLVKAAAIEDRWDVIDRWTAPEYLKRYQKDAMLMEDVVAMAEMHRNPDDPRRADMLRRLEEKAAAAGRLKMSEVAAASQFDAAGAVHDVIDRVSFAHLFDPIQGHESSDIGLQALFTTAARRLRVDPRFVKLCARLGLVTHWLETGRWPDCADQVPYDFRAEARRLADTPLG
jgi:hypothetical protein